MKRLLALVLLIPVVALEGCATREMLTGEIQVHSERQLSNAFLPWTPANPRSLAGSYYGETGDTTEYVHLTVNDAGKHVLVEGRFVTKTAGSAPSERPIEATRLVMETPPSLRTSGEPILFVTYMDPLAAVFKRPVNGLIHNGLFHVKESELTESGTRN